MPTEIQVGENSTIYGDGFMSMSTALAGRVPFEMFETITFVHIDDPIVAAGVLAKGLPPVREYGVHIGPAPGFGKYPRKCKNSGAGAKWSVGSGGGPARRVLPPESTESTPSPES